MDPTRPTTVPQPLSGMVEPAIDLATITDPWEQRVTAISLIAGIRAAVQGPGHLYHALPPVMSVSPLNRELPSPNDFRAQYLPHGDLLAPHQVDGWIREQALREGEASRRFMGVWVQEEEIKDWYSDGVLLADGTKLRFDPIPGSTGADVMGRLLLEYVTPLGDTRHQPVRGGGVLDILRQLSLSFHYLPWQWTEAQGTMFVLTGLVPYAAEFAELVAVQHGRRPRPMSLKHLTLGVFTAAATSGEGLAQRMARWNNLHSEWAYTSADQFSSDSARALRRLAQI